tara:strand:+ start:96 stop:461 length:366 start_codon:yes stop_codon:yes gene_type:complete
MAVTVTNQSNPLGSKLVQDSSAGNTAADNTTGSSGTLYLVEIDNTANASIVYFKMADSADATAGTTAAGLVLMVPASTKMSFAFPTGISFSTGFSHWCVTGAAESNTTAPGSAVVARYITS